MKLKTLNLDPSAPVATIRLSRPAQGNAADGWLAQELAAACETLEDAAGVRVVVLAADGDDFCRGWDDSTWKRGEESALDWATREGLLADPFGCLARLSRPVIAAVQGRALDGGLALALACDVRIASSDATFGLSADGVWGGALARLARLVGRAAATSMALTGEPVDAEEALRRGLVSRVVAPKDLESAARDVAARMAARGPLALRYAKEAVVRGLDMTLEQALRYETDLTVLLQTTDDRAEGVRAFLEKRKPEFEGR